MRKTMKENGSSQNEVHPGQTVNFFSLSIAGGLVEAAKAVPLSFQHSVSFPLFENIYGAVAKPWMFERHKSAVAGLHFNTADDLVDIAFYIPVIIISAFITPLSRKMAGAAIIGQYSHHVGLIS